MNSEPKVSPPNTGSDEPRVARQPVPLWLVVLAFFLIYWGMLSFDLSGGWFSKQVYGPFATLKQLEDAQPESSDDPYGRGYRVYHKPTCVACHQADGKGLPGQFPPLVKSEWVNEKEPGRLIRIVLNGFTGEFTFQGVTYNGATMIPFKDTLSDQEIADVLTFVRQNKEWGNDAPVVTPDRVAKIRDLLKDRSAPFTPAEIEKISPAD